MLLEELEELWTKKVFKTEEKRFPCDSELTQQRVTLSQCDTLVYYK